MRILTGAPTITVISRPSLDWDGIATYLGSGVTWEHNLDASDAEVLAEFAGRVCYQSFGAAQYTKGTGQYLSNILSQKHGSVLEHSWFSFALEGISRSLSLELVRHAEGTAISQQSQRYVDESDCSFVMPPELLRTEYDDSSRKSWTVACELAQQRYGQLVNAISLEMESDLPKRERRIRARQAARAVLPNCAETQMVWSANLRALRWVIEARGSRFADLEMQRFARQLLWVMRREAPILFADMEYDAATGEILVGHSKV